MALDLPTSLASLAVVLYVLVAIRDIRTREIPNSLVIGIVLLGLLRAVALRSHLEALASLGVALLAFALVVPLFIKGWLGGGDAKLIPASVFLVGYEEALGFLINMSLLGGVLSLIILAGHLARTRIAASRGPVVAAAQRPTVPYGVAIAGAAMAAVIHLPPG